MSPETYAARISEARALIKGLLQNCELPQIEAILRNADMELHWALWNLGVEVPLRPELEDEVGAVPPQSAASGARDAPAVAAKSRPDSTMEDSGHGDRLSL